MTLDCACLVYDTTNSFPASLFPSKLKTVLSNLASRLWCRVFQLMLTIPVVAALSLRVQMLRCRQRIQNAYIFMDRKHITCQLWCSIDRYRKRPPGDGHYTHSAERHCIGISPESDIRLVRSCGTPNFDYGGILDLDVRHLRVESKYDIISYHRR